MKVQADHYFNNQAKYSMYGDMAQPVDLNGGLVTPKADRCGMCAECGNEVQDNIRERFGLECPTEGGE